MGEGGKESTAGGNHPDFIAIPHGADGADDHAPLLIGATHKGKQPAYAVVKAFQKEERGQGRFRETPSETFRYRERNPCS